jgi:hypothetical protein
MDMHKNAFRPLLLSRRDELLLQVHRWAATRYARGAERRGDNILTCLLAQNANGCASVRRDTRPVNALAWRCTVSL